MGDIQRTQTSVAVHQGRIHTRPHAIGCQHHTIDLIRLSDIVTDHQLLFFEHKIQSRFKYRSLCSPSRIENKYEGGKNEPGSSLKNFDTFTGSTPLQTKFSLFSLTRLQDVKQKPMIMKKYKTLILINKDSSL